MVYDDLGDYDKAFEYYEKSLGIQVKVVGHDMDVPASYTGMDNVYKNMEKHEKVLEKIKIKLIGHDHTDVALSIFNNGHTAGENGPRK